MTELTLSERERKEKFLDETMKQWIKDAEEAQEQLATLPITHAHFSYLAHQLARYHYLANVAVQVQNMRNANMTIYGVQRAAVDKLVYHTRNRYTEVAGAWARLYQDCLSF